MNKSKHLSVNTDDPNVIQFPDGSIYIRKAKAKPVLKSAPSYALQRQPRYQRRHKHSPMERQTRQAVEEIKFAVFIFMLVMVILVFVALAIP